MALFEDDELVEEARLVRPYTLTKGRTRPGDRDLPLEALVRAVDGMSLAPTEPAERRRIVERVTGSIESIAELSAHLELPLGVVRVLVGDLADDGIVAVHAVSTKRPTTANLKLLESVLNGISSL